MNLSYWELDTYFRNIDFLVIGSGIVGLSTAYHLKKNHPKANVLVVEKGILPSGASTKNAGFACFGTLSEILWYLESNPVDEIYSLVEKRYLGLQKLRALLGDDHIDFQQNGGYEIFRLEDEELMNTCLDQLGEINKWLFPIFHQNPYQVSSKNFGFAQTIGMIESSFDGQIHTGNMMKSLIKIVNEKDITILNDIEVKNLNEICSDRVEIEINEGFRFQVKKAFVCTNGFAKDLYDLDVFPARAQVLITKPIKDIKIKGCFHMDQGYYYFRNVGNRVLFGGGRNLDLTGETAAQFGTTDQIQNQLEKYLAEIILPGQNFEIEHRWSGIMGMGSNRNPIVKQISENVFCGVRLSGVGVAIGSLVGEELANLL